MDKKLTREEVAGIRDRLFSGEGMTSREQKAIMEYVETLELKSPPAPAQVSRIDWTTDGRATRTELPATAPTPPPGLREAVGRFQQWVSWTLNQYEETAPDDVSVVTFDKRKGEALTLGDLRAILAAYDATGGETPTGLPEIRAALEACPCDSSAPCAPCCALLDTLDEKTAPKANTDAEDAAKYRAAVECIGDGTEMARIWYAHDDDEAPSLVHAGRWLLGLTLDTPQAAPLDVLCSRCGHERGMHRSAAGRCASEHCECMSFTPPSGPRGGEEVIPMGPFGVMAAKDAPTRARIVSTPTPETPPLEDAPDTFQAAMRGAFLVLDQCDTEERQRWEKVLRMLEDAAGPAMLVVESSELSPEELPPREWSTFAPPPMPQPTAPAVAWEADGVRVLEDGALQCFAAGEWRPLPVHQVVGLASMAREASVAQRAASALNVKRDGEIVRVDLLYPRTPGNVREVEVHLLDTRASDGLRVSYDFDRDGWAVFQPITHSKFQGKEKGFDVYHDVEKWHEVVFLQSWSLEAEGADPLDPATRQDVITQERHKAAESMRERIARALLDQRDALDAGKSRTHDGRRRGLEEAATIARGTPVE